MQIQIIRIQLRVPEYGWTTQKVFHLLNFLVCSLRCAVFALRHVVQKLPLFIAQAALLDLPGGCAAMDGMAKAGLPCRGPPLCAVPDGRPLVQGVGLWRGCRACQNRRAWPGCMPCTGSSLFSL